VPNFFKKELRKDFFVYSFYSYEEIEDFILSKYHFHGDRVFNILAKLAFSKFASNFSYPTLVYALPIDDHTRHDFSHTAILAKHLKTSHIKPLYNTLRASNVIKYAGKDLKFRQNNPRNFIYKGACGIDVILVDDLMTTGTTLLEAKRVLEQHDCKVLFALTLCSLSH
jgi:competence protein ComFC